jgi:hypothetical protein
MLKTTFLFTTDNQIISNNMAFHMTYILEIGKEVLGKEVLFLGTFDIN